MRREFWSVKLLGRLIRKPLSSLTAVLAGIIIVVPLYQRSIGSIYLEPLNYVDGTTLIVVGILLLVWMSLSTLLPPNWP